MQPRRTALVTGANRGLGFEVARRLLRLGHRVLLGARDLQLGVEAARALASEGDVRAVALDVASPGSIVSALDGVASDGCDVDVLVNNAGVYPHGGVLDASDAAWNDAIAANFTGPLSLARLLVPAMIARGFGRVVNVSSGFGSFGEGLSGPAPYAVTKAALDALTKKLAQEVRGDVKVNACCPGWCRTRMGGAAASRSVAEGADVIVWLATLAADGPNGGFFRDRKPIPW
jgi:NAD(P)-dependent dehydrogenase (short-subunit alcohol dehydrogenase family)